MDNTWDDFMAAAIAQARLAQAAGDVPIGAVVARDGIIIASEHNRRIIDSDPTAHAEILAIRAAAKATGDWRLTNCTLIVTLEPCCMCAGAIVLARMKRIVFGATDPKAGAVETLYHICSDSRLNHSPEIVPNIQRETCSRLLTNFFRKQRSAGKK